MSSIPPFHHRAAADAEERTKAAQSERARAEEFLSMVDELLNEANEGIDPAA